MPNNKRNEPAIKFRARNCFWNWLLNSSQFLWCIAFQWQQRKEHRYRWKDEFCDFDALAREFVWYEVRIPERDSRMFIMSMLTSFLNITMHTICFCMLCAIGRMARKLHVYQYRFFFPLAVLISCKTISYPTGNGNRNERHERLENAKK